MIWPDRFKGPKRFVGTCYVESFVAFTERGMCERHHHGQDTTRSQTMELFLKGIVTKEEAVVSGKTRSSAGAFR